MENKNSSSLHHLFAPNHSSFSSSSSSPTSEIFRSIVRSSDLERERKDDLGTPVCKAMKYGSNPDNHSRSSGVNGRKEKSFMQGNQSGEPHYFSSSIYYGGRENYSPRTSPTETYHTVKKSENYDDADDAGGSHSNGASRGNWWEGSLYY